MLTSNLQFSSVWPDRDLLHDILEQMKDQWIPLTNEARHDLAAAWLRMGEIELAQDEITNMEEDGTPIKPWLYCLLVEALSNRKDFEAILRLVYHLHDGSQPTELPRLTWLMILQQASRDGHFPLTEWIWEHYVEPMYIKPDSQTCINSLRLAAAEGKHRLALSVHGVLKVLDPTSATETEPLLARVYEKSGVRRTINTLPRPNAFAAFDPALGLDKAFFDPKLALVNPSPRKRTSTLQRSKSLAFKQRLKETEKRAKVQKRRRAAGLDFRKY
jgi:hypothetical protein